MNKKTKILSLILLTVGMLALCSCDPVLSLNPRYSYSEFEINLGEKISTDIEEYVDFTELTEEDARFVRENTELLYDGRPVGDRDFADVGDHELTINYCGHQYRKYKIVITDKEPPVFTRNENYYTFFGLGVDENVVDSMFRAKDNSGKCKLKIDKSDVDFNKAGDYVMKATAVDPSGNKTTAEAKLVVQKPEYGAKGTYVFVSISNQTLTYFVDGKVALNTPVVTGNIYGHNTPRGTFRLLNKATNVTLKGREDNGDDYESFVRYWMAFLGSSYGLHDADWRASFGGNIYQGNGSHGCVNMPVPMAGQLFGMIEYGTPILIY